MVEERLTIKIPCDDVERSQDPCAEFSRLVREALEAEIVRRKLPKPTHVTGTDKGSRPEVYPDDDTKFRWVFEHEYIFHYSEQGPSTPTEKYLTQMVHEIFDSLSRKDTQTI